MERVTDKAIVSAKSNVFKKLSHEPICLPDYATIEDYFNEIGWPQESKSLTVVFLNGLIHEDWDYMVQPGDHVNFVIVPGGGGDGGKQTVALVASLALTIFSAGVGSGYLLGTVFTTTASQAAAGAIIGVVGNLLIGAVFKPPVASNNTINGASEANDPFAPSPLITGQSNSGRIGGVIPKIFGEAKIVPDLASTPYITKHACRQVLHALYCTGYGFSYIDIGSVKFGGIASVLLPSVELGHGHLGAGALTNVNKNGPLDLYEGRNQSIGVGYSFPVTERELTEAYIDEISTIVQVAPNSTRVYFDFVFPSGLFQTDSAGNIQAHRASITIERYVNGAWVETKTGDLDGDGVSSCSRVGEDQNYITGSLEDFDITEKYWGDIREVVSGGGGGGENNIIPSNNFMFDPATGAALSFPGIGSWNSGEGQNNQGEPLLHKNVVLTQEEDPFDTTKTKQYAQSESISYVPPSNPGAPAGRFNIHFDLVPNKGSNFAAGNYRISITVSDLQKRNPFGGEAQDDWESAIGLKGYMWITSQKQNAMGRSTEAVLPYTKSTSRELSVAFELTEDTYLGAFLRIGFTPDNENSISSTRLVKFRFDALKVIYTPPDEEEIPVIQTVIEIGVKNTTNTPEERRMPVPSAGSNFYPASRIGCSESPDYKNDTAWPGKCLRSDTKQVYRVVGNPVAVGTSNDGERSLYHITLDRQLAEVDSEYYILENVYDNGFHVSGITRNPLHLGVTMWCNSGSRFRVYKSSTTPAHAVDALVLNALNCSSKATPIQLPPNAGNLNYGIIGLRAEADNLVGQQLKTLSVELTGACRSFDINSPGTTYEGTVIPPAYDDSLPFKDNTAKVQTSGDPAWSFMNVLLGNAADRPIGIRGDQYLGKFFDLEAFSRWSKYCKHNGYSFNLTVDSITTIGEMLQMIAAVGKARPIRPDGKYSILFDGDPEHFYEENGKKIPIATQLITPNNSWGMEASITYVRKTHGLKLTYLPLKSNKQNTVICYDEGFAEDGSDYNVANSQPPWKATKFETMNLPGVTDSSHAISLGDYYLAQNRLRRERLSVSMDMENLISIEGDVVAVAHDVLKMGGIVVYVTETTTTGGNHHVRVSEPIPQPAQDQSIGIRFRYFADGQAKLTEIIDAAVYPADPTNIIYDDSERLPNVGDMLIWGETETVTQDYQITDIKYSNDLTARLEMLEYIPDVANAKGRSTIGETPTEGVVNPPTNVTLDIEWKFVGSEWLMTFVVDWDDMPGITGMGGAYRVNFQGATAGNQILTDISEFRGNPQPMIPGQDSIWVCVRSIDIFGNESELPDPPVEGIGCANAVIECPGGIPADVRELNSNFYGKHIELTWIPNKVEDPIGYVLKYLTEDEYRALPTDENGVPIVTQDDARFIPGISDELISFQTTQMNVNETVTQAGLVFCIWVESACGYSSDNPAISVLDYERLEGVTPDPDISLWQDDTGGAVMVNVEDDGFGRLQLKRDSNGLFYSEGWLLSKHYEDHGVRGAVELVSILDFDRYLFEYLLAEMVPLSIADPLSGRRGVDRRKRFAEVYTWKDPVLSAPDAVIELIDPINDDRRNVLKAKEIEGTRIYYGIRLVTDVPNITPRVMSSWIKRTYNERTIGDTDVPLSVVAGQTTITQVSFSPKFCNFLQHVDVIPRVSVTTENLDGSVVWDIINRDHAGFQIRVKNANVSSPGAQFDWTATGYGRFCP